VGERVVIAGGGMVGCETAEYLIQKGKRVFIVEMLPELALDVERLTVRRAMMERFSRYELGIMVNSKVEKVTDEGLVITQQGEGKVVDADTVVLALGAVPNDTLPRQLRSAVQRLYIIGDGLKPGRIVDAMNQASYLAHHL
jgi:pyruvate/2-oxoglutarate dehydrogenase complex dihydrolipoamide dehydrogenase (E3) component